MTSSKSLKFITLAYPRCFEAILHLEAMSLDKNGCNSNERQSFELSENLPTGKVFFLFSSLRKSRLKFTVFSKIVTKITKLMKLNLKLCGCL
jgi:hypothetical protein